MKCISIVNKVNNAWSSQPLKAMIPRMLCLFTQKKFSKMFKTMNIKRILIFQHVFMINIYYKLPEMSDEFPPNQVEYFHLN